MLVPTFLKLTLGLSTVVGSWDIVPAGPVFVSHFPSFVQTSSFVSKGYQEFHFLPSFPILSLNTTCVYWYSVLLPLLGSVTKYLTVEELSTVPCQRSAPVVGYLYLSPGVTLTVFGNKTVTFERESQLLATSLKESKSRSSPIRNPFPYLSLVK